MVRVRGECVVIEVVEMEEMEELFVVVVVFVWVIVLVRQECCAGCNVD